LIQASSFDTIGWFARDIGVFANVGQILLQTTIGPQRPRELVIAQDAFDLAEPAVANALRPAVDVISGIIGPTVTERLAPNGLAGWTEQQQVLQGREAWQAVREWIETVNPRFSFEVSDRYVTGKAITDSQVEAGQAARDAVVRRMNEVLPDGVIACLPTTIAPAPPLRQPVAERSAIRARNSQLTCIAGLTGRPQINLPVAEVDGLPVGLSLLGPRGGDELLIDFASVVAGALER
jgi:amidase